MDNNIPNNISFESAKQLYTNLFNAGMKVNQSLGSYMAKAAKKKPAGGNDPLNLQKPFNKAYKEFWSDPQRVVNTSIDLYKRYLDIFTNISQKCASNSVPTLYNTDPKDRRFQNEAWENNPFFNFIKQAYVLNSAWLNDITSHLKTLSPKEYQKVNFYTHFLIDLLSPTNFGITNPDAIKEAISSNGQSVINGAEQFSKDLLNSAHGFKVSSVSSIAFEPGVSIAATSGSVVYQNDLMQLIEYRATTPKVYEIPLLIVPAWINKFYIFDLQSSNSFIKWLVDQGYTVYIVSWINPNESHKDKGFYDYMNDGIITATQQVKKLANCQKVNLVGYCLGGTLLACTIAYLKAKGLKDFPIKSTTFLTTLVDFEDAGDLGVFIDEEQLIQLEKRMNVKGFLEASDMNQTFNMIRANDIIWSFFVNNYLLGKEPAPFDILFWNSDSTRLPSKVHSFYLRNMYLNNLLVKPNALKFNDIGIDLSKNDLPTYMLATRQDHIVLWQAAYRATQHYTGPIKFVLSASGHVAGVINHPSKNKYSYWTNGSITPKADDWLANATENPGSWWTDWHAWQAQFAGKKIAARVINPQNIIEPAPGSYIKSLVDL